MDIYILRHGIAVPHGTHGVSENDRPLTGEGEKETRRAAKGMRELKLDFDVILSSPYLRAKQTAEITADILGFKKRLRFSEHLISEGDPKKLVDEINGLEPAPQSIVLVGHEPYLSSLISVLTTGHRNLNVAFKKGGLCKLSAVSLHYGKCARLEFLFTPRHLDRMR
jgi:phosphohistidine phosphatase